MRARRPVVMFLAFAAGVGATAPSASSATTKVAPLVATAAFPGGVRQTWRASLEYLLRDGDPKIVSRPSADRVIAETYGTVKTGTGRKRIACQRVDVSIALSPAVPGQQLRTVARALLPQATWEDYSAWTEHGDLRGTTHDKREAWRGWGYPIDPSSHSVAVGDWRRGSGPGWAEATEHSETLSNARGCSSDLSASAYVNYIVREARPSTATARRAVTSATTTAKRLAPLVATAAFPDAGTRTWKASLGYLFSEYGGRVLSRPAPNRIVFELREQVERRRRSATAARWPTIRCETVDLSIRLVPAPGALTADPLAVARTLRPKATTEDFLATGRHGATLSDTGGDIRSATRRRDSDHGDTIRATQVSDWLGGGSGWRVATAHSHIDSWADECIDMTPSADSYTDELLFGDRVN